ncbi:MAG: IS3 family transposase [Turicibacter sp.]|nr:IS3 family transposase [Turicibacter sp.]
MGIIKAEMFYLKKFYHCQELIKAIEEYIHFYKIQRRQKNLKGLTPNEYRSQSLKA